MNSLSLNIPDLDQQLDLPLDERVTEILCGQVESLYPATERLHAVWTSDDEPRLLTGLPWGMVLAAANLHSLQGWRMPRVSSARTLAENLQSLSARTDWTGTFVPQNVVRSPLTPHSVPHVSRWQRQLLSQLPIGTTAAQRLARVTIEAGARLLWDDLDGSHRCSQSIEGEGRHRTGDYWHALMHRREPDYGNSLYWFRRVGEHPAFAAVAEELQYLTADKSSVSDVVRELSQRGWRPEAMVHACEDAVAGSDALHLLQEIQYREMLVLYRFSCQEFLDAT